MNKLLTIAIPTYNRAQLLDKQLAWLEQAIKGYETGCEIIISDNCSTDETPRIIQKWQAAFRQVSLKLNRNSENVGAIRNIAFCMNTAAGKYVWTISDDDPINDNAISYILNALNQHPQLALLILNFSSRHAVTGKPIFARCFDVENDEVASNGKAVFERYLAYRDPSRWGGLALTTALVYRTDLAQRSLQEWPSGLKNLTVQMYITAYCALHGNVKVTKDTYLECAAGTHFFMKDKKMFLKFRYAEVPETFVKLMEVGYSRRLCRRKVLEQRREFEWKFIKQCLRKWPATTIAALVRYLASLWRVHMIWFAHS